MTILRLLAAAGLALAMSATAGAALDRRVTIVNETGFAITNFYGSNTGAGTWEEDILGTDILPTGSSTVVNFDDASGYCMFDFKAVFDDGDELVKEKINICEITSFTYN